MSNHIGNHIGADGNGTDNDKTGMRALSPIVWAKRLASDTGSDRLAIAIDRIEALSAQKFAAMECNNFAEDACEAIRHVVTVRTDEKKQRRRDQGAAG